MKSVFNPFCVAFLAALVVVRVAAANDVEIDGKFVTKASSGPPLEVSSSAVVSGLNADLLDGLSASDLASSVHHIVVVAKSGGDFSSIQAAIDSVTDEAEDNRYLVWVGPGIYNEQVTLKDWVALQGVGESSTTIRSSDTAGPTLTTGEQVLVRYLNVEANDTTSLGAWGIHLADDCAADLSHVTVKTTSLDAGSYAITGFCDSIELSNVEVNSKTGGDGTARGINVVADDAMTLWHVTTTANGGRDAQALIVVAKATGSSVPEHEWAFTAEHVEAHAWGASELNEAVKVSGDNSMDPGPIRFVRLTATADGGTVGARGLTCDRVHATLDEIDVTVRNSATAEAANFAQGTSRIFQSRLRAPAPVGTPPGIVLIVAAEADVQIVNSLIEGTIYPPGGQLACLGTYDEALGAVDCTP